MPGSNRIQVEGTVVEGLSATRFRVTLQTGKRIVADLAGKVRLDLIRILPGDRVLVEFSPYDLSNGRIVSIEKDKKRTS